MIFIIEDDEGINSLKELLADPVNLDFSITDEDREWLDFIQVGKEVIEFID